MEKIIQNFFEHGIRIHFKSKTKVTLENKVLDPLSFYEHSLKSYPFFKEYVLTGEVWQWNDKDKAQHILKIWSEYFAEMRQRMANSSSAFEGSSINTSDFELVSDFHSGEQIVYNTKQRFISKMHPKTFMMSMGKSQRSIMMESGIRVATFSFNPYNDFERRIIQLEGQEVVEFNCFHAPMWRCDDKGNVDLSLEAQYENVEPPKDFLEFMEHLIPKEDQRNYVYMWMYHAVFHRNETYLCLNGKKGAGKNYFVELLSHLVGRDYFKDANQRFFEEGFNSVLDKARLIQLDEIRMETDLHVNRLKKYINRDQNLEYKGIDANKLTETFNSFIVNNNDITDLRFKWDERRFSVPDLTSIRLEELWPKDRIDNLYAKATDIEFQRQVGFFIRKKGLEQVALGKNPFTVLRGERYWKVVYNSLAEWERIIVDMALSRHYSTVPLMDIKQAYRRRVDGGKMFPLRLQKVKDFLDDYRHLGLEDGKLGEVIGEGDDCEVVFSKNYCIPRVTSDLDSHYGFNKKVEKEDEETREFVSVL